MHNLFYISAEHIKDDHIIIDKEELHHVKNVLRIKKDDILWLTDGIGNVFQAKISSVEKDKLTGQILTREHVKRTSRVMLELAFVPLKGSRNDILIEKGAELGVSRFRPFISKYSVIKKMTRQRIERFQRIALSAMLQSKQYYLPDFMVFESIDALLETYFDFDLVLLANEQGDQGVPRGALNILYIVGPEGGFDDIELEKCQTKGARLLSLGQNRLRSETAGIAGISKILAAYGQV
jgi:16S rRNA (uracil1498-N3)-methyltransferase